MILPHLEYGDFIVDTANQFFINKLDRLQDKAIRLAEYRTYENTGYFRPNELSRH